MLFSQGSLFWQAVTRLGEAQILLPALLGVLVWLVLKLKARPVALTWLLCVSFAALLTTATKVAFIGWGLGIAPINFTGVSGHAMFAAAVLPVLAATLVADARPRWRVLTLSAAYLLAAAVAVSRVMVRAHSPSEAVAGFLLGSAASALALGIAAAPAARLPKALIAAVALWMPLMSAGAPPSRTHDWVTRLSLQLSGHEQPYTRTMMLLRYRLERQQLRITQN